MNPSVSLSVVEARTRDVGRGVARVDPDSMLALGLEAGDLVSVTGSRAAPARVLPTFPDLRGQDVVQIDGLTRHNAGAGLGESVALRPCASAPAESVVVRPLSPLQAEEAEHVAELLDGLVVQKGDRVRATLFGSRWVELEVLRTRPRSVVVVNPATSLTVEPAASPETDAAEPEPRAPGHTYEDIGGLGDQLDRIREMIELPLRNPAVFAHLGISPPKGVLMHGPPGTGKTLIARALAGETDSTFFTVNGPEIIHKFYGESEAHLRKIFEEASSKAPSIIFLDEMDAIAPQRERSGGDVEKRVVAQLLALMDGLDQRGRVVVIGATNIPDALDPALRRPGRFDRELEIPVPDRHGRLEILEIHTRGMPLCDDVDLRELSEITHGFVGADLQGLCREAAMICLRSVLVDLDRGGSLTAEQRQSLQVSMDDFRGALQRVEASAVRGIFSQVPTVGFSDIGGLSEAKKALTEAVIWPLKHRATFEAARLKPPKGLLLSGPPGTGKTLLAKALARESGVNFIPVKGPELMSMFVGESERGVREVFKKARQAAPCILFLDEIDALVPRRGRNDTGAAERVVGQFLTEVDGIEELQGVFVLAATNRPDMVDPAVKRAGRLESHLEIGLPDLAALREIVAVHTKGRPLAPDVDLEAVAAQCVGKTGAEVELVCRRATYLAVQTAIEGHETEGEPGAGPVEITAQHFAAVLEPSQG